MFSASGDKEGRIVKHRRDDGPDCAPNVPLLIDIAVVQHGVRTTTNSSVTLSLAFDKNGSNAAGQRWRDLGRRRKPEVRRQGSDAANVECVQHSAMGNC